ncbi:hypothetical protein RKD52_001143 [Metabacillus sp. SLBN-84]
MNKNGKPKEKAPLTARCFFLFTADIHLITGSAIMKTIGIHAVLTVHFP